LVTVGRVLHGIHAVMPISYRHAPYSSPPEST